MTVADGHEDNDDNLFFTFYNADAFDELLEDALADQTLHNEMEFAKVYGQHSPLMKMAYYRSAN